MKYLQKAHVISILLIFFGDIALGVAQPITESEATPSASVLEKTKILITEISFKNAQADFVKFTVSSAPQSPLNLKGLTFQDDSDFKTLNTDFLVYPGQVITLLFKQSAADAVPTINTTRTGLTATTEQIIIKNEKGTIMDAACWASSKPTESELTELSDLYTKQAWISNTPGSCIPSDEVETDAIIQRKSLIDTNSLSDWEIIGNQETVEETPPSTTPPPTPNPPPSTPSTAESTTPEEENNIEIEELPETEKENDIESEPITISTLPKSTTAKSPTKTVTSKTTKKSSNKKKSTKKTYQNGDESSDIHINEIMANPSEPDQQNEWIEIINTGTTPVNMGNWQLDDDEGGSKPYVIPDTITLEPNTPLLIPITESKISLANKQDTVRIMNYNEEIIDEVTYQDAGEDMSYARISIAEETRTPPDTQEITPTSPQTKAALLSNIIEVAMAQEISASEQTTADSDDNSTIENTWMWVKEGTPGQQNPAMQKIHATISEEPRFDIPYSFKVKPLHQNKEITIYFDESIIKAPLAESLFTQNAEIDLLLKPDENGDLWMEKYEVLAINSPTPDFSIIPWLIIGFVLSGGGTFLYLQKKLPWQKNMASSTQKSTNSV